MACILLWSSAVRVHDSQVYRKMDVTREGISLILSLNREKYSCHSKLISTLSVLLLSVLVWLGTHISYNWAQILEVCDCLKLLSIYFNLCVDATGAVCHQLGLLGADLHAVPAGSPSSCGDAAVCVLDINRQSLPTPFYSVLLSVSDSMAFQLYFIP